MAPGNVGEEGRGVGATRLARREEDGVVEMGAARGNGFLLQPLLIFPCLLPGVL